MLTVALVTFLAMVIFRTTVSFKVFVIRLLQPSIIYIDDAEKTFMKKVPKTDKTDPKRLKKDLPKIVKSIGPTDLVLAFIFNSSDLIFVFS